MCVVTQRDNHERKRTSSVTTFELERSYHRDTVCDSSTVVWEMNLAEKE